MSVSSRPTGTPGRSRTTSRILAVLAATAAAVLVWLVFGLLLDNDLVVEQAGRRTIGLAMVLPAALACSLAGWAVLAIMEKFLDRARTIWVAIASVFTVVSLLSPITAGVDTVTKVALSLMHVVVGAVLIPWLARTSPRR